MFSFNGFTQKANKALNAAILFAEELGHTYIGSEHILAGILKEDDSSAAEIIKKNGIDFDTISEQMELDIGKGMPSNLTPNDFTPRTKRILETSLLEARKMGHSYVGTEHILLALISENDCYAVKYLELFNADIDKIKKDCFESVGQENKGQKRGNEPKQSRPRATQLQLEEYHQNRSGKHCG